ncbi:MAG: hypothetical protein AAF205_02185 [Pseudomonadota bacterium]
MLGSAQVELRDHHEVEPALPLEQQHIERAPRDVIKRPDRADYLQTLALVTSLGGDMPLRMASEHPHDIPSLGSASMRLRRFVRFYPAFSAAALFKPDGRLVCTSDFREGGARVDSALFNNAGGLPDADVLNDPALARAISHFGGDVLLFAGVKCPRGEATCGVVVARLR